MNSTNIVSVLPLVGIATSCIRPRGEWIMGPCPFSRWTHMKGTDRNPSFGVKVEPDGPSAYNCFTCKEKGTLRNLSSRLSSYSGHTYRAFDARVADLEYGVTIPPWEDSSPPVSRSLPEPLDEERFDYTFPPIDENFHEAVRFLGNRNISLRHAVRRDVRVDEYRRRILFKVRRDGKLYGAVGRSYTEGMTPKVRVYYHTQVARFLLGSELLIPEDRRPLIVIEGGMGLLELDSCSLTKYGSAVALMGSSMSAEQAELLVEYNRPLVLLLDQDPAGRRGAADAMKRLRGKADAVIGRWPDRVGDLRELTSLDLCEIVEKSLSFIA